MAASPDGVRAWRRLVQTADAAASGITRAHAAQRAPFKSQAVPDCTASSRCSENLIVLRTICCSQLCYASTLQRSMNAALPNRRQCL